MGELEFSQSRGDMAAALCYYLRFREIVYGRFIELRLHQCDNHGKETNSTKGIKEGSNE